MPENTGTTEPVSIGGAVTGVGVATLALLTGTEVITPEVSGYCLGLFVAVIALITTVVRSKVEPLSKR